MRRRLRHELAMSATAYKVVGYLTDRAQQWEARYGTLPADVHAHLESLWDDTSRDEEEIDDEHDQTLESHGL